MTKQTETTIQELKEKYCMEQIDIGGKHVGWELEDPKNDTDELFRDFTELVSLVQSTERERYADAIAYCRCGDSLERKELYPNEATYYCMGCDETYVLKLSINSNVEDNKEEVGATSEARPKGGATE